MMSLLVTLAFLLLPYQLGSSFSFLPSFSQRKSRYSSLQERPHQQELVPPPNRRGAPHGGDMAYINENIQRQKNTYYQIRESMGEDIEDCIRDVYGKAYPQNQFWYIGKLAFTSGTVSEAVALQRQWNLLQEHGSRLRPVELGRAFGRIEIFIAPGDSEVDVSNNEMPLKRIPRPPKDTITEIQKVSLKEIGLNLEIVTNNGLGFRVDRSPSGGLLP
mmetsp:Transcript_42835/g.48673  ORF Transcript_42835/g.48673 Transcript_42835/m.48673 type:complete len:217 (+) Transcript_42835:94-744(+)